MHYIALFEQGHMDEYKFCLEMIFGEDLFFVFLYFVCGLWFCFFLGVVLGFFGGSLGFLFVCFF